MVSSCCAFNCTVRAGQGYSMHKFPTNKKLFVKWMFAIRRKNFTPSLYTYICSKHFTEDSFIVYLQGQKRLKKNAVPTIFDFSAEKARKKWTRRNAEDQEKEEKRDEIAAGKNFPKRARHESSDESTTASPGTIITPHLIKIKKSDVISDSSIPNDNNNDDALDISSSRHDVISNSSVQSENKNPEVLHISSNICDPIQDTGLGSLDMSLDNPKLLCTGSFPQADKLILGDQLQHITSVDTAVDNSTTEQKIVTYSSQYPVILNDLYSNILNAQVSNVPNIAEEFTEISMTQGNIPVMFEQDSGSLEEDISYSRKNKENDLSTVTIMKKDVEIKFLREKNRAMEQHIQSLTEEVKTLKEKIVQLESARSLVVFCEGRLNMNGTSTSQKCQT